MGISNKKILKITVWYINQTKKEYFLSKEDPFSLIYITDVFDKSESIEKYMVEDFDDSQIVNTVTIKNWLPEGYPVFSLWRKKWEGFQSIYNVKEKRMFTEKKTRPHMFFEFWKFKFWI